jgi:hypothetical protein
MIAFIDDHSDGYGVEPICKVLPIAPSTYHARLAQRRDPDKLSARVRRDLELKPQIAAFSPRTSRFTACARSGDRCSERDSPSPAAPWSG